MTTQSTEEAAITAALEAAATTDAALIQAFITANGGVATTLETNATALAASLSDAIHQQEAQGLADQFAGIIAGFQALLATVQAQETAPPPA